MFDAVRTQTDETFAQPAEQISYTLGLAMEREACRHIVALPVPMLTQVSVLGSFWLLLGCFWAPLGLDASGAPLGRLLGRLLVRSWGLLGSLMAQQSPRSPLLGLFGGFGGAKMLKKHCVFV